MPRDYLSVTHTVVSIELTGFERGDPFEGDLAAALAELRDRITCAHTAQIARRRRSIIVLEGLEGAGKVGVLKGLASSLDPRFTTTHAVPSERRRSSEGHWLARFWRDLPGDGRTVLYFHSWYRRVLEDRVLGVVELSEVNRAHDEINEFEAQQRDHGTLILKLFFHVTEPVRQGRLAKRAEDPADAAFAGSSEMRHGAARPVYDEAVTTMLAQTHTRWSPWTVIDANHDSASHVTALGAVASAFEQAYPPLAEGESVLPFRRPSSA